MKYPYILFFNAQCMFFNYIRSRRFLFLLGTVYMVSLVLNAIGIHMWLPSCPIYKLTGYECLGCGTNRALIDLLGLKVREAWHHNPLVFFYIPAIIFLIGKDFHTYFLKFKHSKQYNEYGKI